MADRLLVESSVARFGQGGVSRLIIASDRKIRRFALGVETVGGFEIEQGLFDSPGVHRANARFVDESAPGLGNAVTKPGPYPVDDPARVTDGAQKHEDPENPDEIQRQIRSAKITGDKYPQRPHVGGVDRATQAGGPLPVQAGLTLDLRGTARRARILARSTAAPPAPLPQSFAGVPIKEAPSQAEKVSDPTNHKRDDETRRRVGKEFRKVVETKRPRLKTRLGISKGLGWRPGQPGVHSRVVSIMKTTPYRFFAASGLAVAFCLLPLQALAKIGQTAPAFTLTDITGKTHGLADFKGKTVVLEWVNPECPFVEKHYESGNLPSLQKAAAADGVIWLLINSGKKGAQGDFSPAQAAKWSKEVGGAQAAYLRDQDGKVGKLYGAKTTPHMFVINKDGVLVYDGAIDSIRSTDKDDIKRATNYVTGALAALKAGKAIEPSMTKPYGCSVKY